MLKILAITILMFLAIFNFALYINGIKKGGNKLAIIYFLCQGIVDIILLIFIFNNFK